MHRPCPYQIAAKNLANTASEIRYQVLKELLSDFGIS
jgi:hypothetical protein